VHPLQANFQIFFGLDPQMEIAGPGPVIFQVGSRPSKPDIRPQNGPGGVASWRVGSPLWWRCTMAGHPPGNGQNRSGQVTQAK